jgi:hypothetical protein
MNMSKDNDRDMDLIMKAAQALGENFDAVQIFVSRHEPEVEKGTIRASAGVGNWYARVGQVGEWLMRHEEEVRAEAWNEEGR